MTDTKEIKSLKGRMEERGAIVRLGYINDELTFVQVVGAKGIGPHPMGVLSAAERMREWLAA